MTPTTINLTELAAMLGVSRPTAYQIVRSEGFPRPIPVGTRPDGRTTPPRWNVDSVNAWRNGVANDE